jgi:ABC-type branched-subunit amino acid transport system substrate-binding protein
VAAVAGCSSKDDEPSATAAGGDTGTAALETGPGVSDDTITLGVLTDQSGPFAGASKGIAQGRQLFWDARNADGGVCDRNVEFTVNDHAYNAQNATTLYADMQPDVLAFDELLGSPMIDALLSTDLTAAVTALEDAGASVVLLTATPPQAASAVAVAQANGLDLTFVGSNPTFSPALLASPAAGALEASYVMVSSIAPYASDAAGPAGVREAFAAEFAGETPTHFVLYGYAQGELMAQILETACENGALTRPGLQEAFQSLDDVDTEGLVAPMDFSDPGQPPAREVHILKPDASVDGGLSEVQDLFASPLAADFQLGT